ncbi:hypothetical protein [Dokdonella koreensis]|uniref:hypothetical protein n=1 Tax=Dokdonella koreensis TaxID=323415 RepID=UPI000A7BAE64|nr:hypothetical protein [Dokdonella koreensis]
MHRSRYRHCALLGAFLAAGPAAAATYAVGPGRPFASLQALFTDVTLRPGDVVEVDGGASYPGGAVLRQAGTTAAPIVLRGRRVDGRRPLLSGGVNTIELRRADHVVVEGFEITGGSSRCVFVNAADVVLRDLLVRDCSGQGILSSDQDSGSLTLEYSEIRTSGGGDSRHALYIQTDEIAHPGAVFRMRYNYLHDGLGGNLLKSRAERNEIHYNWFENAYYHELELIGPDQYTQQGGWTPDLRREDSEVLGNVIVHGGSFGAVIRLGGDGTGESRGRYRIVNNTIVATGSASNYTVLRLFEGLESVEAHNNVIHRTTPGSLRIERSTEAAWSLGRRVAGSYNWVPAGATDVPAEWTGTLLGQAPGFVDAARFDFRPSVASPLNQAGHPSPASPAAWPFPAPTPLPLQLPPIRQPLAPGTGLARPPEAPPTIGALTGSRPDPVFRSGFDG